jgi:hypothetical protein
MELARRSRMMACASRTRTTQRARPARPSARRAWSATTASASRTAVPPPRAPPRFPPPARLHAPQASSATTASASRTRLAERRTGEKPQRAARQRLSMRSEAGPRVASSPPPFPDDAWRARKAGGARLGRAATIGLQRLAGSRTLASRCGSSAVAAGKVHGEGAIGHRAGIRLLDRASARRLALRRSVRCHGAAG